jgi:hypothetical protein
MDESKPRRPWLTFGIRDLLWAMVVVGMAIGWALEYRRHADEQRSQRQKFEQYVYELSDLLWKRTEEVELLRARSGVSDPVTLNEKTGRFQFVSPAK